MKLLGQLHQRAVALDPWDRHLRLEGRWFRCLLPMFSPDSRANPAIVKQEALLIALEKLHLT